MGVNSGVPAFIRGPTFIRTHTRKCYVGHFTDVQGYEKNCYCYILCPCLCSVSFVKDQREYLMQHAIVILYVYTICGKQLKNINLKYGRNFQPINKRLATIRRLTRLNAYAGSTLGRVLNKRTGRLVEKIQYPYSQSREVPPGALASVNECPLCNCYDLHMICI